MTQKHIGALLVGVWLVCAALLLNGAVVRIPPSRPSAVRVQAAGVASTGTAEPSWRTGLIAEYLAANYSDGTWTDSSGRGHHAVQTTAGAKPTAGSGYVSFDGGDQVVAAANSDFNTAEFTVVAKIEVTGWSSGDFSYWFERGVYPNRYSCLAYRPGGRAQNDLYVAAVNKSGGQDGLVSLDVVNVWTMGVWDDRVWQYVSGSTGGGTGATGGGYAGFNVDQVIGCGVSESGYAFVGKVYWVRIFDRELTDAERAELEAL